MVLRIYPNRILLAAAVVAVMGFTPAAFSQGSFVNFENPQVHPIDMNSSGSRLAVCNTAANRVDFYTLNPGVPVFLDSVPVGYDPVTVRFRTTSEAWVVNHISDTISVVNINTLSVIATIDTTDEPCDVVFAGTPQRAFVSGSFFNTIQVFNPTTYQLVGEVEVLGEDPRALSVSADGSSVYAAVFESGNSSTIIMGTAVAGVGSPPLTAMHDPTGPYRGQNPPPNTNIAAFQASSIQWRLNPTSQTPVDWTAEAANYFTPAPSLDTINNIAPRVGHIVQKDAAGVWRDDMGSDWTNWITGAAAASSGRFPGWDIVDNDVAIIDANNPTTVPVEYVERLMTVCMAMAVNPVTGDITVVGTELTNVIRFEPNIEGTFTRVLVALVDPSDIVNGKTIVDINEEHLEAAQFAQDAVADAYHDGSVPQTERDKSIGDPRGVVWNAAGTHAYIAGMGSNNLTVIDTSGERVSTGFTVELEEGPTGLAIDNARQQIYALNRFEGSISVIDITTPGSPSVEATVPFFDPTPEVIKTGRKHLYDTHRNSGLGQIACASCHIDSRMDKLAWDLGNPADIIKPIDELSGGNPNGAHHGFAGIDGGLDDFHPMKGPMTTQTLQDIIGKEPLHWRGDRDDLEEFGGAFVGLQGADAPLVGTDMQEFKDFLATTHFPPNPFRNLDNSLPTDLPLTRAFSDGRFGGRGGLQAGDPLPNGNAVTGLVHYRSTSFPNGGLDGGILTCVLCHTLPMGNSPDINTNNLQPIPPGLNGEARLALVSVDQADQQTFKVPHLRAIFDKAGFELTNNGSPSLGGFGVFHDGSIDSITRFVSEPVFDFQNDQQVADMVALMFAFSGGFDNLGAGPGFEFPITQTSNDAHAAVGKQTTFDSPTKNLAMLAAFTSEAALQRVDLIAKTNQNVPELGWVVRGWHYNAATDRYLSDRADEGSYRQQDVLENAAPGTEVTFTVVPFGTGARLGVDRDEDGILDFDEVRDLDPYTPGIQNPFDPDNADSTGDNFASGPDGIPDGLNDFDNDGIDNGTEFATPGGSPMGPDGSQFLPAIGDWGIALTLVLMLAAFAGAVALGRRKA